MDDFLADDSFQEWVKKDLPEDREFWQKFIYTYPQKEKEVREAHRLLSRLKFVEAPPDHVRYQRIWQNIQAGTEVPETIVRRMSPGRRWISVAAAVIILFSLGMWWMNSRSLTIQTGRADVRKFVLADQSTVMLNANSRLTYRKNFNSAAKREVWLEGEAKFNVRHLEESASITPHSFIVHTPELDLEVLGTSFNVKTRRSGTNVMLAHGSVLVRFRKEPYNTVLLKPGEMLEFAPGATPILHKAVDSLSISAWTQQRFVFSNTPLNQAIQQIEDFYDCTITVKDSSLLRYRITASVTAPPVQELETVLAGILNMKVIRKGDVLEIVGAQQ
ncbi:FecR family protein [Chitinophaga polysaccharea]|uniref:FecR family protein n=1 Tax=Chitinophaga polysaccharea TaxID=1293035 RepID=UPI00163C9AC8|nr:FecR domain-containing protein [Chitinophaga polysaccharea]